MSAIRLDTPSYSKIRAFPVFNISMSVVVALDAKCNEILRRIIAESAPPFDVMDLKAFHPSARLATPAVSVQDFAVELAITCRVKP